MEKLKWPGSFEQNLSFEKDRAYGFSWPQRNYRCSFCKKEFKSAQALGGHMNVHRKDRARMRLNSPSWDSMIKNPNPNFSSSTWTPLSSSPASSTPTKGTFQPYNYSSSDFMMTNLPSLGEDHKVPSFEHSLSKINHVKKEWGGEMGNYTNEGKAKITRKDDRVWKANHHHNDDQFNVYNKKVDLNMGLVHHDAKEDLDLELRLWY